MEQEVHSIVKTEEKRLYNTGKYLQMSRKAKATTKHQKNHQITLHPSNRTWKTFSLLERKLFGGL